MRSFATMCAVTLLGVLMLVGKSVAADHEIRMRDNQFAPRTVTVQVGDRITWSNLGADTHTATANNQQAPIAFDTGDVDPGKSSNPVTFNSPGTVAYHCQYHGGMAGKIVVEDAKASKYLANRSITVLIQNAIAMQDVVAEYSRFYGSQNRPPLRYSAGNLAASQNAVSDPLDMPNDAPCVRVRLLFRVGNQRYSTNWYALENRQHIKQVIFRIEGVNPTNFSAQLSEENRQYMAGSRTTSPADLTLEFSGTSQNGSFQQALNAALSAAESSAGTDRRIEWSLSRVTGIRGGITGDNKVTVTIDAKIE